MTTKRDEQMGEFWIANVASLDAYPEPVEIPELEIYRALQDQRSSFRKGFLAGRESLRSELRLTDEETRQLESLRAVASTGIVPSIEIAVRLLNRLTAQESESK